MPIFHRQAYEVACDGKPPGILTPEHFNDWKLLAEALDLLTPEQRCNAIYADWLLQLNSPAHLALLQVRNLLIGQGALAANYLAELAQNADDASDGQEAQLRIVLSDDWLFVSNNGRKVTSLNLLGLCRFFVHTAGGVVELSQETIGRFGIGFKSCYRIASEVFVFTWEGADHFAFRLPICREGDLASRPDAPRLDRLISGLHSVGVTHLDPGLREIKCLGYCTPEFAAELPLELKDRTGSHCQTSRGTLFCFHLRPDRLAEARNRISGQAREVYELCPLFLPNVRQVQLAQHELRMKEIRHDPANDLPNQVIATKVELATESPGQRSSTSRFWRLEGANPGDLWQLAVHADAKFRLRVEQEEDEHGTTIKDGAAYAYFPLNAVTWPFRLHLHLKLATNLARNDWNPDESPQVREQIQRAIAGLAAWLEHHTDKWHPQWRFESLVAARPSQNDQWAWLVWNRLCAERSERRLARNLNDAFVKASSTRSICLVERPEARAAWQFVLKCQPAGDSHLELTGVSLDELFPTAEVTATEVAALCREAVKEYPTDAQRHQAALTAFLGCHNLMLHRTPSVASDFLKDIQCHSLSGVPIPLTELCEQPGGTELAPSWHQTFRIIHSWSRDLSWPLVPIEGRPLSDQLKKLAQPEFNPPWSVLPACLGTEEQWKSLGQQFWEALRGPCPESARYSALACLRVPDIAGNWLPIGELWLDDDSPTDCFAGLLKAWNRPCGDVKRKNITAKLKSWQLWDEWKRSAKGLLKDKLPGALANLLADHADKDAFSLVFNKTLESTRRQLDDDWRLVVEDAEKRAVSRFVTAQISDRGIGGKVLLSPAIPNSLRSALQLLPQYVSAPSWLTEAAFQRIVRLGLHNQVGSEFLAQQDFSRNQERYSRELLENYHRWQVTGCPSPDQTGLQQLCDVTSLRQRRDWLVGLGPQKSRRLRDLILPAAVIPDSTTRVRLMAVLLAKAEWRGEPLPAPLGSVTAIAEACIQPDKLELEPVPGTLSPLQIEQLSTEVLSVPGITELLQADGCRLLGSPKPLNLKWRYDGEIVASLDDAEFSIETDRLVVHRFRPPADEEQCRRVLGVFETNTTVTKEYESDAVLSPFERYQKHREAIRLTLLKELVSKVGYEKHHILRELLQNAESAYASKHNRPPEAWFEFTVDAASRAGVRKVVARHAGRAFNEPDNSGKERHDVERIWRLAAETERTPDEVGRFNRGFKTLFTIAANGLVHIRSGDFDFEVIDLLLLKPAEPKPNSAKHSPFTEFNFETAYPQSLEMLRLDAAPGPNSPLPVINPATFVFLAYLQKIRVKFEQREWEWRISRAEDADGWRQVTIAAEMAAHPERFLVFAGERKESVTNGTRPRFASAVRLDANNLPALLEKTWRKFHLTFETEHDFPLDFLVNGDFEADQGRVGLRNIARSGLVELAYEAVLRRAEKDIHAKPTKEVWLAWARVLHLKDAPTELEAISELRSLRRHAEKAAAQLTQIIPHAGALVPVATLEFPSTLFRRVAGLFGQPWGVSQTRWIDADLALALPEGEHHRVTFHGWLSMLQPDSPLLRLVDQDLKSDAFLRIRLSALDKDELEEAKRVLAEKLRPTAPPPQPEPEMPVVEAWSVANLWHWWDRRGMPMTDYTLEGDDNWKLLYTTSIVDPNARRERLKSDLLASSSEAGKRVWYRLFGIACLMSAGRRMTELRAFWQKELEPRNFWTATEPSSGAADYHSGQAILNLTASNRISAFEEGTRGLFAELARRQFDNLVASGEDAHFWRRVFYDLRKIHKLVWDDDFPGTLLELIRSGRGDSLLDFLKTGNLPGQTAWVGVFGQSAGSPLFFLVRELCRLGVIRDPAVKPLAFFVSTPVRRAMERIGWLPNDFSNRVDFKSLARLAEALHSKLSSDREFGPRLLEFYDIPLLHLGLEG